MTLPEEILRLQDIELDDIDKPDYLWVVYTVCATDEGSCGWGGWQIEAIFQKTIKKYNTFTGDKLLKSNHYQVCPICGKPTFRTDTSLRFDLSPV